MDADGKAFSTNFSNVTYELLEPRSIRIDFNAEHGIGRVKNKSELVIDLIDQQHASIRTDRGGAIALDRCSNK